MTQSRYDDVTMADFLKQNYFKQQCRRAQWKEYFGPAYRDIPTQIELRENKQRVSKRWTPEVKTGDDGKLYCPGPVLPVINFPKKAEMRAITNLRLNKKFEERYGNASHVNISNMCKKVHPVVRESIYEGLAHHGEGRYQYLDSRKRTIPEKKFRSRMTTTMDYGWEVVGKMRPYKLTSCFGISSVAKGKPLKGDFFRNNGVINPTFESAGLSMAM